ncbi:MAG: PIF1 family DEAD/DEAH box helicase [Candidatus Moraniibacteriota bacterium]|jgi:ATP-dependent exoDNAse (exonuclease V) alpha subunit
MKQKTALEILKDGHNVFLTGAAGSGKTYLLNEYIDYLKENKSKVAITASTGIAATHIGGRTIHSWSGMGIKDDLDNKDITQMLKKPIIRERLTKTDVLIIDEVSMVHAHQLDLINKILRLARGSWEPFGGMQVVLSGDFFQLPPISRNTEDKVKFAFESQSWKELKIKSCYLTEQFRQEEDDIVQILSDIRNGKVGDETRNLLQDLIDDPFKDDNAESTKLFTHNVDVDNINNRELSKLETPSLAYQMATDGNEMIITALQKGCLAPEKLILKEGALVMFVRNNFEEGYVNGTVGRVIDFSEDKFPIVEIANGEEIVVFPEKWSIEEEGETLAELTQLPLRLAWAITVHKSQGMTLDSAEMDLSKAFEYGMGYVALSRVKTLSNMKLLGINDMALQVHPDICKKDKEFQKLSKQIEK